MKEISKQTWQVLDPSIVYNRQIAKDSHSLFRGMDLEFFQILIEGLAGQMIRLSKSGTRMVVSWELSLVMVNGLCQYLLTPLICLTVVLLILSFDTNIDYTIKICWELWLAILIRFGQSHSLPIICWPVGLIWPSDFGTRTLKICWELLKSMAKQSFK